MKIVSTLDSDIYLFCWLPKRGHWGQPDSWLDAPSGGRFLPPGDVTTKNIVKVYFFINVYGIPPPPLQTQLLLTGQDGLRLFPSMTVLFKSLNQRLAGDVYEQV